METPQHKGEQQHQTPEKCKSPTRDVKEWTPFCEDELKPKEGLEFANLKELREAKTEAGFCFA